jgi:hypothetical protein
MWLATDSGATVRVLYADYPYVRFDGPIVLATDTAHDDISVVAALPDRTVGVLWSNQRIGRFGFRVHLDGTDPDAWLPDEVPASQSDRQVGGGMVDDHLNVAVASDGTLYAAVKTSFDTPGYGRVALLVRRPDWRWDDLYWVDYVGTRPIVLLDEVRAALQIVYTASERPDRILWKESPLAPIAFGARRLLLRGRLNNPTSVKASWTNEVVVIAQGRGALLRSNVTPTIAKRAAAGCARGCRAAVRACRLVARMERVGCVVACRGAGDAACAATCQRDARAASRACRRNDGKACGAVCRVRVAQTAASCRAACGEQIAECLEATLPAARGCSRRCAEAEDRTACLAACARTAALTVASCRQARAACLVPCAVPAHLTATR